MTSIQRGRRTRDPNRGTGRLEDDDAQDTRPPRAQARRTPSRSHYPPGLVGDRCPTPSECPASGRHRDRSSPSRFERSALRVPGAIVRLAGPVDAAFQVSGAQDAPTRHGTPSRPDRGSMPGLRLALGASRRLGCNRQVPHSRDTRRHVGPRRVGRGPAARRPRRRGHRSTRAGHARVRLEIESCDAHSVSPQVQAVSSRAPGTGDEAVRRRRAPTTAAPPRVPRVLGAFDDGRHRRERARRKFALRPRPSFGWRAAKWDRPRATKTTTPPRVAPRERHGRRVPGWQAPQRRGPV